MSGSTIYFQPNNTEIPACITVGVTNSAFRSIERKFSESGIKAVSVLLSLSEKAQYILMAKTPSREQNGTFLFKAYREEGVYILAEDEQDPLRFTMVGFMSNTLSLQNEAMRYGTMVHFCKGWRLQIRFTESNIYADLVLGKQYDSDTDLTEIVGDPFTEEMKKQLRAACLNTAQQAFGLPHRTQEADDDKILKERMQLEMPRAMEKMLDTATQYAELTSQLEQEKAAAAGTIYYTDIRPVLFEDRVDRVCYEFVLLKEPGKKFDETLFRIGGSILINDRDELEHQAEIVEFVREDPDDEESEVLSVRALFMEQVDIASFDKEGYFVPAVSNVNKMVQEAAIDRISSYSAQSAYTLHALYDKDTANLTRQHRVPGLDQVVSRLNQKKYPPNASQMHAITEAIKTDNMYLVMGPPGTGKTTVILEWVKYFVLQEHKRVLVSSKNNKAVDNVLARLAEEKDISTIRIGSEAKLQEDVKPYMFENRIQNLRQEICEKVDRERNLCDTARSQWFGRMLTLNQYVTKQRWLRQMKADLDSLQGDRGNLRLLEGNMRDCKSRLESLRQVQKTLEAGAVEDPEKKHGIFSFLRAGKARKEAEEKEDRLRKNEEKISAVEKLQGEYQDQISTLRNSIAKKEKAIHTKYHVSYEEAVRLNPKQSVQDICLQGFDPVTRDFWVFASVIPFIRSGKTAEEVIDYIDRLDSYAEDYIQITDDWKRQIEMQQNYALEELLLDSVDLVGATCIGIQSKKKFRNIDFDVTIIDESGQIQVHDALVPISLSPKIIMLGDHKQIPPMADPDLVSACEENGVDTELLKKSLFEVMYNMTPDACKIMLDTQYRMPGDIADTISEWFYDGKYISPPFKREIAPKDLMLPSLSRRTYLLIDTSDAPGRHEHAIPNGGCDNSLEAEIARTLIRLRLMEIEKEPDSEKQEKAKHEIGVISAYKAQVKLIRKRLANVVPDSLVREMVASLDSFQGQERDLIVYSFTKSSDKPAAQRRIGFLNELRRLNVAMSRCKKGLVLIGDMQFLAGCRHMDRDESGNPVYEQSEKQFGDFVRKMYDDVVKKQRGECLTYAEFMRRSAALLPEEIEESSKAQDKEENAPVKNAQEEKSQEEKTQKGKTQEEKPGEEKARSKKAAGSTQETKEQPAEKQTSVKETRQSAKKRTEQENTNAPEAENGPLTAEKAGEKKTGKEAEKEPEKEVKRETEKEAGKEPGKKEEKEPEKKAKKKKEADREKAAEKNGEQVLAAQKTGPVKEAENVTGASASGKKQREPVKEEIKKEETEPHKHKEQEKEQENRPEKEPAKEPDRSAGQAEAKPEEKENQNPSGQKKQEKQETAPQKAETCQEKPAEPEAKPDAFRESSKPEVSKEKPKPEISKEKHWKPAGYNVLSEQEIILFAEKQHKELEAVSGLRKTAALSCMEECFGIACYVAVHVPVDKRDTWKIIYPKEKRSIISRRIMYGLIRLHGIEKTAGHGSDVNRSDICKANAEKFLQDSGSNESAFCYLVDVMKPQHSLRITGKEVTEISADGMEWTDREDEYENREQFIVTAQTRIRQFAGWTILLNAKTSGKCGLTRAEYRVTDALEQKIEQEKNIGADICCETMLQSLKAENQGQETQLSEEEILAKKKKWKHDLRMACAAQDEYFLFLLNQTGNGEQDGIREIAEYLSGIQDTMVSIFLNQRMKKSVDQAQDLREMMTETKRTDEIGRILQGEADISVRTDRIIQAIQVLMTGRNRKIRQKEYPQDRKEEAHD